MTEPTGDQHDPAPPVGAAARATAVAPSSVDALSHPDTGETRGLIDQASKAGTSRWVYVFWIVGVLLVMAFVALHLSGAVGPGAH